MSEPEAVETNETPEGDWPLDLYRKWFKTSSAAGFLAIDEALSIGRFSIDIGALDASNKLISATKVWVPAIPFATYLKALRDDRATDLYPANLKAGLTFAGSWINYGGGMIEGKAVSRILKVTPWADSLTSGAFAWKAGLFPATTTASGAFNPDMSAPISTNMIRVSLAESAEISYRVDLALLRHAIISQSWLAEISGKKKNT